MHIQLNKHGFTLIEVLIASFILAICLSLVVTSGQKTATSSMTATLQEQLESTSGIIGNYLRAYPGDFPDTNGYPFTDALLSGRLFLTDNVHTGTGTLLNRNISYLTVIKSSADGSWKWFVNSTNNVEATSFSSGLTKDEYWLAQNALYDAKSSPMRMYIGGQQNVDPLHPFTDIPYNVRVFQEFEALIVDREVRVDDGLGDTLLTIADNSAHVDVTTGQVFEVFGEDGYFEITSVLTGDPVQATAQRVLKDPLVPASLPKNTTLAILRDGAGTPVVTYRVRSEVFATDPASQVLLQNLIEKGILRTEQIFQK